MLGKPLKDIAPARSKSSPSPPAVLIKEEVQNLLQNMTGLHALQAKLLYGAGLRILECLRLRIQDVDTNKNPGKQSRGNYGQAFVIKSVENRS